MAALRDVLAYICRAYPDKNSLSIHTLMQVLYLADWRSALVRKTQITDVTWELSSQGPHSSEVLSVLESDPAFAADREILAARHHHRAIGLRRDFQPELDSAERSVLDFVINATSTKPARELSRLVFSTYPVVMAPMETSNVDLISLAREYQSRRELASR